MLEGIFPDKPTNPVALYVGTEDEQQPSIIKKRIVVSNEISAGSDPPILFEVMESIF
jgi:hypothetical protein